jgi:hypothetical protein
MPVLSQSPTAILDPAIPYERLAFRCSLTATLGAGDITDASLSLHATKYRKTDGKIDVCGIREQAEIGASLPWGGNRTDDGLILQLAELIMQQSGEDTGALALNFSWREEAGDIVGMVQMQCGDWVFATGNSNTATDEGFVETFPMVIAAIANWCENRGW